MHYGDVWLDRQERHQAAVWVRNNKRQTKGGSVLLVSDGGQEISSEVQFFYLKRFSWVTADWTEGKYFFGYFQNSRYRIHTRTHSYLTYILWVSNLLILLFLFISLLFLCFSQNKIRERSSETELKLGFKTSQKKIVQNGFESWKCLNVKSQLKWDIST